MARLRTFVLFCFCTLGVGAGGPTGPTTQDIETVTAYHQAVVLYRQGRLLEAVGVVRAIERNRLTPVRRLMAFARAVPDSKLPAPYQSFAWSRLDLLAAGLLQGDASLLAAQANDGGFDVEVTESLAVLRLADVPRAGTDEQPGTSELTWARAAGVVLLESMASSFASTGLTFALHDFPDDGPLLLTMGTLREAEAGPLYPPENPDGPDPLRFGRNGRDRARDEARDALEHAVRIMPGSDAARARLASVLISIRKDDRAAPLLEAVSRSADVEWAYLATTMLGGVHERAGDAAGAERLYRQAMIKMPDAQAARVALSALQYAAGKTDEAASTLEALLARRATAPPLEPWWEYPLGSSKDRDAAFRTLADLRAQVRK